MPKTFLIRKKQGLKNVWCAPEAEVFGHIDYRNSDESFRTGNFYIEDENVES
jgi:hypothetical protein